jgi:DNA-binding Lrp family transcriptional regulator
MADEDAVADLDEADLELLARVERDFDVSLKDLAEELELSKSAVHYRLKKHRDNGTVRGTKMEIDPLSFGLNMMVITEVSVNHESGYAEEIGEQLSEIPGVQQVYYTMGDTDFVVISRTRNRERTNQLIDDVVSINGVNETSSQFVMKELKTGNQHLDSLSPEMRRGILATSE